MIRTIISALLILLISVQSTAQNRNLPSDSRLSNLTVGVVHYKSGMKIIQSGVILNGRTIITSAYGVSEFSRRDTSFTIGNIKVNSYRTDLIGPRLRDSIFIIVNDILVPIRKVTLHPDFIKASSNADLAIIELDTIFHDLAVISDELIIVKPFLGDTVCFVGIDSSQMGRTVLSAGRNVIDSVDSENSIFHFTQFRKENLTNNDLPLKAHLN